MRFSFDNIVNVGVNANNSDNLNRKIRLANQIALIIALAVAVPFFVISLIYFKSLVFIVELGFAVCFAVIGLNYFGLVTLSRIIISVLPILLSSIYQAYLCQVNEPPILGSAMISLSFSFIVYLVFDLTEWVMILLISLFCVYLLLNMDELNVMFEMKLDNSIIKEGIIAKITVFTSILTGAGCMINLSVESNRAIVQVNTLLHEYDASNALMIEKEKELNETLSKIKESQEEENKRQWATEGINKCNDLIRNTDDAQELYDKLVSFIVKYIDANQGGLFLLNDVDDENKYLNLTACYAYDRKKYLEKTVAIGDGSVGQCFLEGETIYLTDVPEGFARITSGLGEAMPSCVILVPLKINEQIFGVFEIASFYVIPQYQIDFLTKVCENIASSSSTNSAKAKTTKLLAETQTMAEELKAQEEETRQNLEEMQSTQEELQRIAKLDKESRMVLEEKVKQINEKESEIKKVLKLHETKNQEFENKIKELDKLVEFKNTEIINLKNQLKNNG